MELMLARSPCPCHAGIYVAGAALEAAGAIPIEKWLHVSGSAAANHMADRDSRHVISLESSALLAPDSIEYTLC
jgi:hypothetical protein